MEKMSLRPVGTTLAELAQKWARESWSFHVLKERWRRFRFWCIVILTDSYCRLQYRRIFHHSVYGMRLLANIQSFSASFVFCVRLTGLFHSKFQCSNCLLFCARQVATGPVSFKMETQNGFSQLKTAGSTTIKVGDNQLSSKIGKISKLLIELWIRITNKNEELPSSWLRYKVSIE